MASKNILGELRKLSKRIYTLNYNSFSFTNLVFYETYYSRLRKRSSPSSLRLISQYFIQSILGIKRTDYARLEIDYLVGGGDSLISAIAAFKLLQSGHTVAYWPYYLEDYGPYLKACSDVRSSIVPDEALKLIASELNMHVNYEIGNDDLIRLILERLIDSTFAERFIVIETSSIMEPFIIGGRLVALAKKLDRFEINAAFNLANKCKIFGQLKKGLNSRYNRRVGRVVSLISFRGVVFTSPKTKSTPRIPEGYEFCIGEAHRKTHEIDELRYSDRNEDILQALAINELIRGQSNGIS